MRRRIGVRVAVFGLGFALGGCELLPPFAANGGNPPPSMAWSPRPVAADPSLVPAARKACLIDTDILAGIAPNLPLVIQDQRGPEGAFFVWADATNEATCLVARRADGTISASSISGSGGADVGKQLTVTGTGGGPPNTMFGDSGPGKHVVVQLADGTVFEASTGGGRFAAWWPKASEAVRVRSFDNAGTLLETYDIENLRPVP
jgi:hypothetical protein